MTIAQLDFVDLHLGVDYFALTQVAGRPNPWEPPAEYFDELMEFRGTCLNMQRELNESEFPVTWNDVRYRVTIFREARNEMLCVLRRNHMKLRSPVDLGFNKDLIDLVNSAGVTGLFLVVGGMGEGKSDTASAMAGIRVSTLGGIGMSIEDPIETCLDGKIGKGRFIQVWARNRTGGYRTAIQRAMRSGAGTLFIGEIRDEVTAYETLLAGINGTPCFSTMHAGGISEAIQRLEGRADNGSRSGTRDLIASGLTAVIFQELVRHDTPGGRVILPKHSVLVVEDAGIRTKIRRGDWAGLEEDVRRQTELRTWCKN